MVSSDISDVVIASVHSEKTCLKKLMKMMIMNKLQEMASAMKLRPEK